MATLICDVCGDEFDSEDVADADTWQCPDCWEAYYDGGWRRGGGGDSEDDSEDCDEDCDADI